MKKDQLKDLIDEFGADIKFDYDLKKKKLV